MTYSGQYHAFAHFSKYVKRGARIFPAETLAKGNALSAFPNCQKKVEICAALNPDGTFALIITNSNNDKCQLQYYRFGKWWYIEALPNSISTIIFEND